MGNDAKQLSGGDDGANPIVSQGTRLDAFEPLGYLTCLPCGCAPLRNDLCVSNRANCSAGGLCILRMGHAPHG